MSKQRRRLILFAVPGIVLPRLAAELVCDRLELLLPHQPEPTARADALAQDVATLSPRTIVRPNALAFTDATDFQQLFAALQAFASTYPFQPADEDYLVHVTPEEPVASTCLSLLAQSRHIPAKVVQIAPYGPPGSDTRARIAIVDLDLASADRLVPRPPGHEPGLSSLKSGIDTRNAAYNRLIDRIEQVALASRAPLLLVGAEGAGKSRLARRIFDLKRASRQVTGDLVSFNCATLRGDAATSALFGHRRGAFAGATRDRPGLLRAADRGVLFLDEIGELGSAEQAMLLRALEHKTFLPLGADREISSDLQLIAGTNRDLAAAVRQGRFREDLFVRINLWTFQLPGLAQRPEDLAPNLDHELAAIARTQFVHAAFSPDARQRFLVFATSPLAGWPANFHDFNAAIVRMATLAPGGRVTMEIVEAEIAHLRRAWTRPEDGPDSLVTLALGPERSTELDRFDRVQLEDVLRVCRERRTLSDAGRLLYSVSRTTKRSTNDADRLRKYLARFGLEWQTLRALLDQHV